MSMTLGFADDSAPRRNAAEASSREAMTAAVCFVQFIVSCMAVCFVRFITFWLAALALAAVHKRGGRITVLANARARLSQRRDIARMNGTIRQRARVKRQIGFLGEGIGQQGKNLVGVDVLAAFRVKPAGPRNLHGRANVAPLAGVQRPAFLGNRAEYPPYLHPPLRGYEILGAGASFEGDQALRLERPDQSVEFVDAPICLGFWVVN